MVTVLIPLYNGEEFLQECLNSIKQQSYKTIKIFVITNGSKWLGRKLENLPDNVYQISCAIPDNPYIKNFKSFALNYAFSHYVDTPYTCLLDVDDKWDSNKIASQLSFMEDNQHIDICGTYCQYFGDSQLRPTIPSGPLSKYHFGINPMINSSVMIRSQILPYWNLSTALEDYELWLRCLHEGKLFFNLPSVLTYHRIHKESFFNTQDHSLELEGLQQKWLK